MARHEFSRLITSIVAFCVSIAFWPGLAGAATSPRWAIAALSLGFLDWYCLPFVAICFTLLSFDAAVHWAIVCAAFCWGLNGHRRIHEKTEYFSFTIACFCCGIAISGAISIAQSFGWSGIPQVIAPAGLFANKNFLGEAAALAFIAAASARLWPAALICLPALALSTSRAAWLGAFVGLLFLASPRQRLLGLVIAPFAVFALWWFGYLDSATLIQRFALWQDAMQHLAWFGNGSYDYSTVSYRDPHHHNDWLQLIYELGLFGLMPLAAILAACWNPQAIPFVAAFLIIGSFGFPLQMPATAWFAAFVIGHSMGRVIIERRMVLCPRAISPQYA